MSESESSIPQKKTNYKQLFIKKHQFRRRQEAHQNADEYLDLISFSLLEEIYGISLMNLKEIMKAENVERIPKSPDSLIGILNLRGSLITVVNLKKRLGFDSTELTKDSRIIIVEHEKRSIGFLVDKVNEIMKLERRSIVEPPKGIDGVRRKFIEGIGKIGDQDIILPKLEEILAFT